MTDQPLWKIAVDAPLPEALTYQQPLDAPLLRRGQLVNVPLGLARVTKGLVLGPSTAILNPEIILKPVRSIDEEFPLLPEHFIKWLEWLAQYYMHPVGHVAFLAYPPLSRKQRTNKSSRPPVIPLMESDVPPEMTHEQQTAFENISKFKSFSSHLVFGVTGSGKTEIY